MPSMKNSNAEMVTDPDTADADKNVEGISFSEFEPYHTNAVNDENTDGELIIDISSSSLIND